MGNPTTPNLPVFLAGSVLVTRDLLSSWPPVITYLLPLTSGVLNTEFENIQTQIAGLLAATPNPAVNPELVQIPIQLIVDMQNAFCNFEYKFGGPFSRNDYVDTVNQIDSVFNQYSRFFYDSKPGSVLYYNNG